MVFGLTCKTSNCLYFKKWKDLYFENIPECVNFFYKKKLELPLLQKVEGLVL